METTLKWIEHFEDNLKRQRVNWMLKPNISTFEKETVLHSLQAWQLGETSDGSHLVAAASKYAELIGDPGYTNAVRLFIKEEQKHGDNLGRYLEIIGETKIHKNWGDSLFRLVRYFNRSIELWTFTVIVVESTAQVFYQSLKDATQCELLKQICTDILIDEAYHIEFQMQRIATIFQNKSAIQKFMFKKTSKLFFNIIILTVWFAHRKVLNAGKSGISKYLQKMNLKYAKTLKRITAYNIALKQLGLDVGSMNSSSPVSSGRSSTAYPGDRTNNEQ